jgi:serine/threonine protein kinase
LPREQSVNSAQVSAAAHGLLTGRFTAPGEDKERGRQGDKEKEATEDSSVSLSPCLPVSLSSSGSGRHYWQSVARIGIQVAEALAYAHGMGTLHRDIKPSNLLLDAQGIVWVTDFGLAKASDSGELTADGEVVGTLRYIPPERFKGLSDARGDVYSLGLTLYELLTLRTAFAGDGRHQLLERILCDEAGFQQMCEMLLASQLANAGQGPRRSSRNSAHRGAVLWTLSQRAVKTPEKVVTLFQEWTKGDGSPAIESLGPAYYRAGRFDDAVREFGNPPAGRNATTASNWFFLAMARHHSKDLEQQAKARASLAQGVEQLEAEERSRNEEDRSYRFASGTSGWVERLINQILRREAEEELKKPAGGAKR